MEELCWVAAAKYEYICFWASDGETKLPAEQLRLMVTHARLRSDGVAFYLPDGTEFEVEYMFSQLLASKVEPEVRRQTVDEFITDVQQYCRLLEGSLSLSLTPSTTCVTLS